MNGGGIVTIETIKDIHTFNSIQEGHSLYPFLQKHYVVNELKYKNIDWYDEQIKYINNLTQRQKEILFFYTLTGDKIVNNYLRDTLTESLVQNILFTGIKNPFRQLYSNISDKEYTTNIIMYIKKYINELEEIIHNSPKLKTPLKVFRGVAESNYIKDALQNNKILTKGFLSTSMNIESATLFAGDKCCILEMYVPVSVSCLFIAPVSRRSGEFEIVFLPNTITELVEISEKIILDSPEYYDSDDVVVYPDNYDIEGLTKTVFTLRIINKN